MIGVARSRWLTGSCRSLRMVTRMLTTTYASSAASRTARPPTLIATRRRITRGGGAAIDASAACVSGRTDGHRHVEVGDAYGHRRALGTVGARHGEHALDNLVGRGVDPDVALGAGARARDQTA